MKKEREVVHMESNQRQFAREQFIAAMLEGHTFREVSAGSPPVKRALPHEPSGRIAQCAQIFNKIARICKTASFPPPYHRSMTLTTEMHRAFMHSCEVKGMGSYCSNST